MRILIVDDSRAMRLIIARSLRQAGLGRHEIVEADNGRSAIAKVKEGVPQLILCDWNMPEMSGIEFLRKFRAAGFKTPFGFITSESTDAKKKEAMEAGAEFLLAKPFTAEDLEYALEPYV